MRIVLKATLVIVLGLMIYAVVLISKIISFAWYCKWDLNDTEGLHNAVGEVVFEIIKDEE